MAMTLADARRCPNRLLHKLADTEFNPLCRHLEPVDLRLKTVLHERGHAIKWMYFPGTATISNLIFLADGSAVEVGTVGNEGVSAAEVMLGAAAAAETAICQIAGSALRVLATDFRSWIREDSPLHMLAACYLQSYMTQMSQSVACNRRHTLEQRLARWLLISHDRAPGDQFKLTQEFLAEMLGAHRPSVSLAAAAFQKNGLIKYSRGGITIVDRLALEKKACECYGVVRDQYRKVLGVAYG